MDTGLLVVKRTPMQRQWTLLNQPTQDSEHAHSDECSLQKGQSHKLWFVHLYNESMTTHNTSPIIHLANHLYGVKVIGRNKLLDVR